ncbi:MAG: NAD(P)H-hydrate dehydratase [Candidatus Nealsonbacteria bacterium RIFCSPLOWO2_02_39_8]|uniref:ADP-dependent (S)-NAD(P)H-hydrate dehydratase n=1 Tax=Candidatus Nealsonbacteria bacterium RIFCSPLOWO2_02_39_8 TaxID=1801674 RepID=A0A1G2EH56_9BACT|nr:MAG: NAD(P)H-hydrate dehydratase [Candidatus Nealsonbacteria bacterium RIFCSPLOWO2_02_39_8]
MFTIAKSILKKIYNPRPLNAVKYNYGLLLVIGGSEFYSGSPALAAMAGFRAGADMAKIIAPERAANIIAGFSPTMAAYPLKGEHLIKEHLSVLISMIESAKDVARGKTAVVIGGGLGRTEETQETVLEFLLQVACPVIIDADAIHALAKKPKVVSNHPCLITPHFYEFYVLTKVDISKVPETDRPEIVRQEAKKLNAVILLKGRTDIISDGKEIALNKTGSPYIAKGGCGDTLAGICGALMARGLDAFTAGQAGAYINGLAGQIAAKKMKDSLVATDLIEAIPSAIKR